MSTNIPWVRNPDGTPGRVLDITAGCTRCSPGCAGCWAVRDIWRMAHNPLLKDQYAGLVEKRDGTLDWTGKIKLFPEKLSAPLKTRKPITYFVDSKTDLMHPEVPDEMIAAIHGVMAAAHQNRFILCTKRPERYLEWSRKTNLAVCLEAAASYGVNPAYLFLGGMVNGQKLPLPNVILLVTVEDQKRANERIPILIKINVVRRGISYEPALGPLDLTRVTYSPHGPCDPCVICGTVLGSDGTHFSPGGARGIGLDWVIVGGETGPGARPMHPDWVRKVRDDCRAAGVAFYFKQWGEWAPTPYVDSTVASSALICIDKAGQPADSYTTGTRMIRVGKTRTGRLLDGRTWEEFPEVLCG